MMKAIPELEGMSNQKASSLVKPLKDAGLLKKEIIKGRSFFSVNADKVVHEGRTKILPSPKGVEPKGKSR